MTDRLIRITTAVAAVISYRHGYELVCTHGETGLTADWPRSLWMGSSPNLAEGLPGVLGCIATGLPRRAPGAFACQEGVRTCPRGQAPALKRRSSRPPRNLDRVAADCRSSVPYLQELPNLAACAETFVPHLPHRN